MEHKWCYLLTFNETASSHECMKSFLDRTPEILDWHSPMHMSFFVVYSFTASTLTELIRTHMKDKGRFIVVDLATDRSGWLAKTSWDFAKDYCGKVSF